MKRRNLYTLVLIVTAALALIGGLSLLVLPQREFFSHFGAGINPFGAVPIRIGHQ